MRTPEYPSPHGTSGDTSAASQKPFRLNGVFRAIVAVVVLLTVAARLYLIFTTHATEEDFYITLRYAQNIARGSGFAYNPGEPVLGTTTPLYTLLLALFVRLRLDPIIAGKLVAVAADAASICFVWRLACTLGRPVAGIGAGLCLAVAPLNLVESVKGMEAGLVACACIGAWSLWAEGKTIGAWIAAAVLTLLRIDGAMLAAVLYIGCHWRDTRPPVKGLAVYGLLIAPWLVFATAAFGSPIPTSLRAKLIVYGWHNSALFPNLTPFLRIMTHNPLNAFLSAGALITFLVQVMALLATVRRPGREIENRPPYPNFGMRPPAPKLGRDERATTSDIESRPPSPKFGGDGEPVSRKSELRPPAPKFGGEKQGGRSRLLLFPSAEPRVRPMLAWLIVYYGGMALSKVFLFGWYFLPPTPVFYLIAWLGWETVAETVLSRGRVVVPAGRLAAASLGLLVVGCTFAILMVPRVTRTLRDSQRAEDDLRIPIGEWLKTNGRPNQTVMLEPIGYIGYYSGLRVLDTVGLVSPQVLGLYQTGSGSPYHELWRRYHPDWVLLRSGEWQDLQQFERALPGGGHLDHEYRLAHSWRAPGAPQDAGPAFLLFRRNDE